MCARDPFNKIALTARSRLFDYRLHSKNEILSRQICAVLVNKVVGSIVK